MQKEEYDLVLHFISNEMSKEGSHDINHAIRVFRLARKLSLNEPSLNNKIIDFASLLHDVGDRKLCTDQESAYNRVRLFLRSIGMDSELVDGIIFIIMHVSFSSEVQNDEKELASQFIKELYVVQDADRLDAIGAIGIARAFAYGGKSSRQLYDSSLFDANYSSFYQGSSQIIQSNVLESETSLHSKQTNLEQFFEKLHESEGADLTALIGQPRQPNSNQTTIHHFFDKLLHISSMLKTQSAKEIAKERQHLMIDFLKQFIIEWDGL
ncbi:MAG: putative metal dependent phosphohydrolase [Streblomastix strix]|uniref:Putative metal dependent phosphohydrolase n=1 Tax=Streblomastix strix TaxID=222440 RepID=A0A5J4VGI6_9EUKA|nr:MAG: putative metal dependent phosphohydrolase [Streblomastix strix]